jgi:hypothetical protein
MDEECFAECLCCPVIVTQSGVVEAKLDSMRR